MAANAFLLLASFLVVLLVLAQPLGRLMTGMVLDRALPGVAEFEQGIWRVCGVSDREMNWRQYLCAILLFNALGLCFLVVVLMAQGSLPYNPQQLPGLSWCIFAS
ncbi:potassium-transporting ATPase subunit KdpA [Candidatus Symbiopectobacterium sp.]|uniref:potassium-transporting ATPase subunit KdpA n=1 Tax=Candidatus Symbiopectobacterium sp. TaxID=2816440 RepID=UPI0025C1084D|nr:potassium-transporting ATPase subunit KdpA [Candidatus Symbiopectobacterium sp.]